MCRTLGVETFSNISSPFCAFAILRPPCKILWRSSRGNPSIGGVKHKTGSKAEQCHIRVSHLLMSFLYLEGQPENDDDDDGDDDDDDDGRRLITSLTRSIDLQ